MNNWLYISPAQSITPISQDSLIFSLIGFMYFLLSENRYSYPTSYCWFIWNITENKSLCC